MVTTVRICEPIWCTLGASSCRWVRRTGNLNQYRVRYGDAVFRNVLSKKHINLFLLSRLYMHVCKRIVDCIGSALWKGRSYPLAPTDLIVLDNGCILKRMPPYFIRGFGVIRDHKLMRENAGSSHWVIF